MFEIRKRRVFPKPLTWEGTTSQWVCKHQKPLVIPDVSQRKPDFPNHGSCQGAGVRSFCMFPLKTATRHIGTIYFGSVPRCLHRRGNRFLSLVAVTIGMAVGNAKYFEGTQAVEAELRREKSRLKLLLDLTNCLVSNLRIEDVLATPS